MRNRIKLAIITCIPLEEKPLIIRREDISKMELNKRRVEFEKCYHKGNGFLTSFEMGLMRQLDMFRKEKRLAI